MALTRAFRETVYQRAQRDGAFRKALLTEAVNAYLRGMRPREKRSCATRSTRPSVSSSWPPTFGSRARACIACWARAAIRARPTSSRFSRCCKREWACG